MEEKNDWFIEIERVKQENIFLKKKIDVVSEELNKKIAVLENKITGIAHSTTPIQQDILRKINRNKKGIIKQRILEIIEEGAPVAEAKEILVDRQKFCSKASFYRYVDELKLEKKIELVKVNEEEGFI